MSAEPSFSELDAMRCWALHEAADAELVFLTVVVANVDVLRNAYRPAVAAREALTRAEGNLRARLLWAD